MSLQAGVNLLTSSDVPDDKRLDVALVAKLVGVSEEDLNAAVEKAKGGDAPTTEESAPKDDAKDDELPSEQPATSVTASASVIDLVGRLQKRLYTKQRLATKKSPEEMKADEDKCLNGSFSVSVGNAALLPTQGTIQLKQSPIQVVENAGAFMYMEFPLEDKATDEQINDLITQINTFATLVIPFALGDMLPEIADEDDEIKAHITAGKLFTVGEINADYLVSFCLERPKDKPTVLRGTINLGIKNPIPFIVEKMEMGFDAEDLQGLISQDDTDDDLRALFKSIDANGNDKIDFDEFCQCIEELGVQLTRQPKDMFTAWDTDNDGSISMEEFVTAVRPLYEPLKDMVTDPESGAKLKGAVRSDFDFDRLFDETYDPFDPSIQLHYSAAFGKKCIEAAEAFIKRKAKKAKRSRDQEKIMMYKMMLSGFQFMNKARFNFEFGSLRSFLEPIGKAFLDADGGGGATDMPEIIFEAFQKLDYSTIVRGMKAGRAMLAKEFFEEAGDETCMSWKIYRLFTTTVKGPGEMHFQVGQMGLNIAWRNLNIFQYFPRIVDAGDKDALVKEAFEMSDQDGDNRLKFEDCKFFVTRDIERPFQTEEFKFEQYRSLCGDWNADPEEGVTLEQFTEACKQQGDDSIVEMYNTVMIWEGKFAIADLDQKLAAFDGFVQGLQGERQGPLDRANEAFTQITGATAAGQVVEVEDEGYSS